MDWREYKEATGFRGVIVRGIDHEDFRSLEIHSVLFHLKSTKNRPS